MKGMSGMWAFQKRGAKIAINIGYHLASSQLATTLSGPKYNCRSNMSSASPLWAGICPDYSPQAAHRSCKYFFAPCKYFCKVQHKKQHTYAQIIFKTLLSLLENTCQGSVFTKYLTFSAHLGHCILSELSKQSKNHLVSHCFQCNNATWLHYFIFCNLVHMHRKT